MMEKDFNLKRMMISLVDYEDREEFGWFGMRMDKEFNLGIKTMWNEDRECNACGCRRIPFEREIQCGREEFKMKTDDNLACGKKRISKKGGGLRRMRNEDGRGCGSGGWRGAVEL